MSKGPSTHLSWQELACHDGTPYPEKWRASRARVLAEEFEALRAYVGDLPIKVNSAYRTAAYNAAVGGAPLSQHVQGRALDLSPPKGMTPTSFFETVLNYVYTQPTRIKGLGRYRKTGHLHIDVRPSPKLVRWTV